MERDLLFGAEATAEILDSVRLFSTQVEVTMNCFNEIA
jgi:hypothetical protein